ncbi:replication initiation protein [Azotobacter sp. CWF10]
MPNLRICKSNALVEAAYRLTLGEHRVILACIAQVRRDAPISDQILYEVRALEIAERSGIARQTAYEELEKAAQTLFERYVSVPYSPDGGALRNANFGGCNWSITFPLTD